MRHRVGFADNRHEPGGGLGLRYGVGDRRGEHRARGHEYRIFRMSVSLDLLKSQMNLTGTADDALLAVYIAAAEGWIVGQIGKELATFETIPAEITLATLQLASHWYENREAVLVGIDGNEVPFGVRDLIRSHREWEL
ncbi:MAG: phage gp6-like head-tail connector protein [Mesorhizobium sp.]|nr:MAG: phage gp6-like head-tail connector protein [Mesorhizobium sp.]